MRFEVIVELKSEVLDAEGRAIKEALQRSGAQGLSVISVSKRFVIEVDSSKTLNDVESSAIEYLANPVSETFRVVALS